MIEIKATAPSVLLAVADILRQIPDLAGLAMRDATTTFRNVAKGGSPVGVGPTSGQFKGGWSGVTYTEGGLSFENRTPYGDFLEYGLYPSVGPRTVSTGGQVYSKQAPGGVLGPMLEDDPLLEGVIDQVTREVVRRVEAIAT